MIYKQINQVGKEPFIYQCIDLDAYPIYYDRHVLGDVQLVKICHIPRMIIDIPHFEVLSDKVSTHEKILHIIEAGSN